MNERIGTFCDKCRNIYCNCDYVESHYRESKKKFDALHNFTLDNKKMIILKK